MSQSNYEFEFAELSASPLAEIYRELYGEAEGNEMAGEIWQTLKKYGKQAVDRYGRPILLTLGLLSQPKPVDPFEAERKMKAAVSQPANGTEAKTGTGPANEFEASQLAEIYRELYGEALGNEMAEEIWPTLKQYGKRAVDKWGRPIMLALGLLNQPKPVDPFEAERKMKAAVTAPARPQNQGGGPDPVKELEASPLAEIFRELYGETVANEMLYEDGKGNWLRKAAPYVLALAGITNTDPVTRQWKPVDPFEERQKIEQVVAAAQTEKRNRRPGTPPSKEFESVLDGIFRESGYSSAY